MLSTTNVAYHIKIDKPSQVQIHNQIWSIIFYTYSKHCIFKGKLIKYIQKKEEFCNISINESLTKYKFTKTTFLSINSEIL